MLRLAGVVAGLAIAGTSIAQTVSDGAVPDTQLNLPKELTIFGKVDPNVRKATAIVNNEIITGTDVDHRLALVLASNEMKIEEEERERLRLQVLRNLIDETLQIQEAKANEITITPSEVEQSYVRVARSFNRTPAALSTYLTAQGSSERSIKRQIEGELAWSRLLRRRVTPFINVGEEEVQAIIDRLNASKGTEEYRLGEIYISATPETASQSFASAQRMIEQIRQGGSFAAYARQYSEASTAAVGGDLGWVRAGQLPEALAAAAQSLSVGQIAGPIQIPGGFSVLYMVDQRQVLTADPRDSKLSLRQLAISFPAGTTQAQASVRAADFAKSTQAMAGCGAVEKVAKETGAEVVDSDSVRVRDLPPQLQETMLKMQIGQATPPFGSPTEGIRVLVLCGRDDPQLANAPNPEQIQGQLEEERVNKRAQRMLRDLRRDAVVDYR